MWLCLEGLTDGSLQGAYGVVRLAYNESEDRHYVSLGLGTGTGVDGCCPGQAPQAQRVGRSAGERGQGYP